MKKEKIIVIKNHEFKIYQFPIVQGLNIKYQLLKILVPVVASFSGEALKNFKNFSTLKKDDTENENNLSSLSTMELIEKLDPNMLDKAAAALIASLPNNLDLYTTCLSMAFYNGKPIDIQLDELFMSNVITYTTLDKLFLEVVKHQGFLELTALERKAA